MNVFLLLFKTWFVDAHISSGRDPGVEYVVAPDFKLLSETRCICINLSLFRKYLDKAGVLELLTKSLVQLYEVCLSTY